MSITLAHAVAIVILLASSATRQQDPPYAAMAQRAVAAMKPSAGEQVLIRADPETLPLLQPAVRGAFERAGAKVETIGRDVERFDERLASATIYVWMPGASALTTPEQQLALARWTDAGGTRRELHFHWSEGTLKLDRSPAPHTPEFDRLYADALEIDYAALNKVQDAAIALLRSGEVRVTTPAGTDLRFRTGERPFNKQNGDGSPARVKSARMRIDRHIELPAGIVRVAPMESSVRGVLVIPTLRYGEGAGSIAQDVRLEFAEGKVIKVAARERAVEVEQLLQKMPALASFRELGVGFNPELAVQTAVGTVPYYGYGAGFVRMSLGNNEELAGAVRGTGVLWNFFPDATVMVGDKLLVKDGKLVGF